MKEAILILLVTGALLTATTSAAFAGGDQVRGENRKVQWFRFKYKIHPRFDSLYRTYPGSI